MPESVKICSNTLSDASIAKVEKELDLVRMRSISNLKEHACGEGELDSYVVLTGNRWINHSLGYLLRTRTYGELLTALAGGVLAVVGCVASAWGVVAVIASGQHWAAKAFEIGLLAIVLMVTGLFAVPALGTCPNFVARFWKAVVVSCGRLPASARNELRVIAGTGWAISKLSIRGRGSRRMFEDENLFDWNLPYGRIWCVMVGRNRGMVFATPNDDGQGAQIVLDSFEEASDAARVVFMKAFEAGYPIRFRVIADKDGRTAREEAVLDTVRHLLPEGAVIDIDGGFVTVKLADIDFIASGAWKDVLADYDVHYELNLSHEDMIEISKRRLMPHEHLD